MKKEEKKRSVLILDMQPIDPPTGGGRMRLLGIYHALGPNLQATYVGTYDWPGEKYREHQLTTGLREINIPLSQKHFETCDEWKTRVNGKTIIDSTFHQLAELSPQYLTQARERVPCCDVIFFSHPWIYPLVRDRIDRRRQLIVYDAHNVEGLLRVELLDDGHFGTDIAREVLKVEYQLCHEADLILACSHDDRSLFHRLYQVPWERIAVVPNGVFTGAIVPATAKERQQCKASLGLPAGPVALFLGSMYEPNVDAARFICNSIAPALRRVTFVICGSVCDGLMDLEPSARGRSNIKLAGMLDESEKLQYLRATDVALNPMKAGSGTNIKMFDYLAAGVPVVTTPVGARGIQQSLEPAFVIVDRSDFSSAMEELLRNERMCTELARRGRELVERKYSWERISPSVGRLVTRWLEKPRKPFFSVIVPTYERHEKLSRLLERLASQTYRDFEVLVVDQSSSRWQDQGAQPTLDLLYLHTDVRGATKARNTACFYARGTVLAFVDDDCEPAEDWLAKAEKYFQDGHVVGVEGLIVSPVTDDRNLRCVTNVGFRGIGFMTANLFIRASVFNAIDGFDERFDEPHFREDTDLAWRALEHGRIEFGEDVIVVHPPHKRSILRESEAERNKFFSRDALLMKKHPEKYRELFFAECHWSKTPGFCHYFTAGARQLGIELPDWCLPYVGDRGAGKQRTR